MSEEDLFSTHFSKELNNEIGSYTELLPRMAA
jgi:hypothetical protein